MEINIGVLALQGDFREHINAIKKIGYKAIEIKSPQQLRLVNGLIIPGGESTTMSKLIKEYDFKPALDVFFKLKKPIFGTCAGLILLSKHTQNSDFTLNYIDIEVERNAYGRQVDSFEQSVILKNGYFPGNNEFKAVFIRAPKIKKIGNNVEVIISTGDNVIMARQDNVIVCSFHPELTEDLRIHQYFIDIIKKSINYGTI